MSDRSEKIEPGATSAAPYIHRSPAKASDIRRCLTIDNKLPSYVTDNETFKLPWNSKHDPPMYRHQIVRRHYPHRLSSPNSSCSTTYLLYACLETMPFERGR